MNKITQETLDRINKGLAKDSEIKDCIIDSRPKECCIKLENQKTVDGISFETAYLCEKCNTIIICNLSGLWEYTRALYKLLQDNVYDEVEIEIRKCVPDDDTNHEYSVVVKGEKERGVGFIEFYPPFNDFIFEPHRWAHISKTNLSKISKFINNLEVPKK